MKAKVIDKNLKEYGQIIDVVLNQYTGKYTDGKIVYGKELLSFEVTDNDTSDDAINELAFKLLCAKESSSVMLSTDEEIREEIDYVFNVARQFQEYTRKGTVNREKAVDTSASTIDSSALIFAKAEPLAEKKEQGLSDFISQLES